MRQLSCSLFVLVFLAAALSAQTSTGLDRTWKGPDMALIRELLAEDEKKQAAKPVANAGAATLKFTGGNSGVPKMLADAFGRNAEEKKNVADALEQILSGYNAQVAKDGRSNDLAAALTFFIAANASIYQKTDLPSDAVTDKLYASIRSAISTSPQVAALPNAEKQYIHDWLACMGGFALSVYQESKGANDKDGLATAAELAARSMEVALGINLKDITIGPNGIRLNKPAVKTKQ